MNEDNYLICYRALAGYRPKIASWRDKCSRCHRRVWRAHSSPKDLIVLCIKCGIEMMRKEGEQAEIVPPTPKQLREIEAVLKRDQN